MGDAASIVESLEFKPLEQVAPAPPGTPGAPVVIELPQAPQMPRFAMSEEQREILGEIERIGKEMEQEGISADQRDDLRREMDVEQKKLRDLMAADARAYRERIRHMPHPAAAPTPAPIQRVEVRPLTEAERTKIRTAEKKAALILGRGFRASVRKEGEVVGQLTPSINPDRVIRRVLGAGEEGDDEIPFAIDREGTLYTRNPSDRATLERVGIAPRVRAGRSARGIQGWVVSTSVDQQGGLRIGVARPVGETMEALRRTAARNFGLGLGLIALALIGIVPLSNHLTRDVKAVTEGAERIAHGDLQTR
jgi:hypothetical protein